MKALSLMQPWATLIAIGAKRIETRSWSTNYRGPLAIHASKRFPKGARSFTTDPIVYETVRRLTAGRPQSFPAYPLGSIVATCRLVSCKRIVEAMSPECFPGDWELRGVMVPPPEPEKSFGVYFSGRYGWALEDIVALPDPIPVRGALGLWEWNRDDSDQPIDQKRKIPQESDRYFISGNYTTNAESTCYGPSRGEKCE